MRVKTAIPAAVLLAATLLATPSLAQKPQYGGNLEVGTVYVTISALSFDPQDFAWKLNHDTGPYLETLFAGDLDKSIRRGGLYSFKPDAWMPEDALRVGAVKPGPVYARIWIDQDLKKRLGH